MSILEILADVLHVLLPLRPDNDRSIVGESPMDRRASRFWKIAGVVLAVLAVIFAIRAWMP